VTVHTQILSFFGKFMTRGRSSKKSFFFVWRNLRTASYWSKKGKKNFCRKITFYLELFSPCLIFFKNPKRNGKFSIFHCSYITTGFCEMSQTGCHKISVKNALHLPFTSHPTISSAYFYATTFFTIINFIKFKCIYCNKQTRSHSVLLTPLKYLQSLYLVSLTNLT